MKTNEILKHLRNRKQLNQAQTAELLDVSLSSYQKYERDKNSVMPSIDVLIRIADFYGVTVDYLLGRDTNTPETIEQLVSEYNMTELEKKILEGYLDLPEDMRDNLMDFLQRTVRDGEA